MLKLVNVTSIVVQESMNRNSEQKLQYVKRPAVNTAMLKRAKMKLTQRVNAKAETELIMIITQIGKARLTAVQEQAL